MDPATAFQLVCGAIQLVEIGIRLSKEACQISKSTAGLSTANETVKTDVERLKDILAYVANASSTRPARQGSAVSASLAAAINDTIKEVQTAAQDLAKAIEGIQVDPSRSIFTRSVQTANALRKRGKIEGLTLQLEKLETRLQKNVILDIRELAQESLQRNDTALQSLSSEHAEIIKRLASGEKKLSELIKSTHETTMAALNLGFGGMNVHEERRMTEERREKFLESFFFDNMFTREHFIKDNPASADTYQWIFSPEAKGWDNFPEWQASNEPFYWISGKLGSGKSTLMDFIWEHPQRDEKFQSWAVSCRLILASVFFWNPGEPLQKSARGLLQTLIYQVLKQKSDVASVVSMQYQGAIAQHHPWSEESLKSVFTKIVQKDSDKYAFFIDGLDEFEDGKPASNIKLINLINTLHAVAPERIKVCLSSRPYRHFRDRFATTKKLELHNLTKDDMKKHVANSLRLDLDDKLVQKMVWKAEGVFLWLKIATNSLQAAFANGDSRDEIADRLHELPPELDKMYEKLLSSIDSVYQQKAALIFGILLYEEDLLRPSDVLVITNPRYSEELTVPWSINKFIDLVNDLTEISERIGAYTCGLVEVTTPRARYATEDGSKTNIDPEENIEGDMETDSEVTTEENIAGDMETESEMITEENIAGDTETDSGVATEENIAGDMETDSEATTEENIAGDMETDSEVTTEEGMYRTRLLQDWKSVPIVERYLYKPRFNRAAARKWIPELEFRPWIELSALFDWITKTSINFIHRSVYDFMLREEATYSLDQLGSKEIPELLIEATLFRLSIPPFSTYSDHEIANDLRGIFRHLYKLEDTDRLNRGYLSQLERLIWDPILKDQLQIGRDLTASNLAQLCAEFGFSQYVIESVQEVERNDPSQLQVTLNELLLHAVLGFENYERPFRVLSQLVNALLAQGANPNYDVPLENFFSSACTAWEAFIGNLGHCQFWSGYDKDQHLREMIESFLRHGARSERVLQYCIVTRFQTSLGPASAMPHLLARFIFQFPMQKCERLVADTGNEQTMTVSLGLGGRIVAINFGPGAEGLGVGYLDRDWARVTEKGSKSVLRGIAQKSLFHEDFWRDWTLPGRKCDQMCDNAEGDLFSMLSRSDRWTQESLSHELYLSPLWTVVDGASRPEQ